MLIAGLFSLILNLDTNYLFSLNLMTLLLNFISVFIFIAIILVHKGIKGHKIIYKNKTLLILFGLLAVGVHISIIQLYDVINDNIIISFFMFISTIISGITFLVITFSLLASLQKNRKYIGMYSATKELVDQQHNYYSRLLESDVETKKIRHDFTNHLYYMHYLCDCQKYDSLHDYISDLSKEIIKLRLPFNTGNELVDIISNNILDEISHSIKVTWVGRLPSKMNIIDVDLTSLFANILKNSVEAIENIKRIEEAEIIVEIREVLGNVIINVKNTYNKEKAINMERSFVTSKKDKQNHGFGTIIIDNIVSKYNGRISRSFNDKYFQLEIIFLDIFL